MITDLGAGVADGEMSQLVRETDWSATSFGDRSTWPQSLTTIVDVLLASKFPMCLGWGSDVALLYNDAYVPLLGRRHPSALGQSIATVWEEIWPDIEPLVEQALSGRSLAFDDLPLTMTRNGYAEETWWTFSYSPVRNDAGTITGFLNVATETTAKRKALDELQLLNSTLEERVAAIAAERDQLWRVSRDPFVICDLEGRWINASPVWTEILGWKLDDLLGRTSAWIDHPEDHDKTRQKVVDVGGGEVMLAFRNRFRAKSGAYRTFSWTAVAEGDRLFCVARDVTDEEIRAKALRLYGDIVQSDNAPICAFDTECRLIAFNQAHSDEFFRIYGYRVQIGDVFPELFLPAQALVMRAFMERALSGEVFTVTEEFGNPDLVRPYWEVSYNPLRAADGRIVGAFHHAVDITARLRAQAELRKTTTRAQTYFSFSNDYLFLIEVDAGGTSRFVDMNPACERAVGLIREEIIGRTVDSVLPVESADDIRHYGRLCLQTRQLQNYIAVREYIRGRNLTIEGRVTFVEGEADGSGLLLFSGTDVTERRLAEDRLRQSQKIEAVGQLTGGVAHDFNNLLTIIRGSIDLLRRPGLPEERRDRYIDAISDTTDRATRLTSQLLSFARKQALKAETFDAGASIESLREMLGTLTGSRVSISMEINAGSLLVRADRSQFDTAIVNMAVNARDAMSGEGMLTIGIREVSALPPIRSHPAASGQFVAISISDTGSGIAADRLEQIFEPFYTTKGVGHGTGLGLSQVFGFAKQSSGDVLVRSKVGAGSTFTLYLPKAAEGGEGTSETGKPDTPFAKGARILVVEDNSEVGSFAIQALTELGYKTHLVTDAASALSELGRGGGGFDLVFSDVIMPGMSGIELRQEIRRRLPGLPVVLTSGYSNVIAEQDGQDFKLLQKPYSLTELANAFAEDVDKQK